MELYKSSLHVFFFLCFVVSKGSRATTATRGRPIRMVVKDFRIPLNQNAAEPTAAEQTESQNGASDDSSASSSTESEESQQSGSATTDGAAVGVPAQAANRGKAIKRIILDHSDTPFWVADPYKKSAQDNHWHLTNSTTVAVAAAAVALVALIASLAVGAAIMSHKNRIKAASGFLRTEGYVEMLEIPTHDEQELCSSVVS